MLYWLYELNSEAPGVLRLFGSPVFRMIAALGTAMVTCLLLYPWLIRQLVAKQIGQVVRDDGIESHLGKRGTPTMGGTLLVIALGCSCLLWCKLYNPFVWLTLAITFGYGAVGFIDDWLKLRHGSSGGLSERGKVVTQLLIAGGLMTVFFTMFASESGYSNELHIPYVKPTVLTLSLPDPLYAVFATVVVFLTSTACNLTDGQDGLAIGPTIVAAGTLGIFCYLTGAELFGVQVADYLLLPQVSGVEELAVFCAAMAGAAIGFLWFNAYPAMVMMGDVGALALGGALGAVAVFSKHELLSVLIHGIFVVELLSVVVQRYVYKLTSRRVFAMAPLHHHFQKKAEATAGAASPEERGKIESRITIRFWIVSVMLALLALASIKVR